MLVKKIIVFQFKNDRAKRLFQVWKSIFVWDKWSSYGVFQKKVLHVRLASSVQESDNVSFSQYKIE